MRSRAVITASRRDDGAAGLIDDAIIAPRVDQLNG